MKILTNAVIFIAAAIAATPSAVVADVRHVRSLDSTRLFPDVDFQVDIEAADQSHSPDPCINKQGRRVGKAWVYPAFIQKLQQATGKTINLPGSSFEEVEVQTLYITETTNRHVDKRREVDGGGGNVNVKRSELNASDSDGSMTAFYVQKATADAHFETDDDEMCIPYVEGSAMYFNGGLPHHTVLKSSGAIKLVGPFLLSTMESVGNPCYDNPSPPSACFPSPPPTMPPTMPPTQPPTMPPTMPPTPAPKSAKSRAPKSSKSPGGSATIIGSQLKSDGSSLAPIAGVTTVASIVIVAFGAFLY